MATPAEIERWAQEIGLEICVGAEYAAEHAGSLPTTLDGLVTWGNSTGRRNASGAWTCKGTTGIVPPPGTVTPPGGTPPASTDVIGQIKTFIIGHPLEVVGGLVAYLVLFKRR